MRLFIAIGGLRANVAGAALPCAFASAVAAGLFVQFAPSPQRAFDRAAGVEAMAMLREEHALAAGYSASAVQAQREANLAAEQDVVRMKVAAAAQAAVAEQPATLAAAKMNLATAMAKPRKLAPRESEPVQPPLQLASMMSPAPVPPPAGNIVTRKVRDVVAAVERIPNWVRQAANWVVDLPSQPLPRWPQRFNISSL